MGQFLCALLVLLTIIAQCLDPLPSSTAIQFRRSNHSPIFSPLHTNSHPPPTSTTLETNSPRSPPSSTAHQPVVDVASSSSTGTAASSTSSSSSSTRSSSTSSSTACSPVTSSLSASTAVLDDDGGTGVAACGGTSGGDGGASSVESLPPRRRPIPVHLPAVVPYIKTFQNNVPSAGRSRRQPVRLAPPQLSTLLSLHRDWSAWPGNGNQSALCSSWAGVACNGQGIVTDINLAQQATVQGTIPSAIGALASLSLLDLSHTGVHGSIPESISGLSSLVHLDLSYTSISGTLPSTLGALSRLTCLTLRGIYADVTGALDELTWLGSLTGLKELTLFGFRSIGGFMSSLTFLTGLARIEKLVLGDISSLGELPWDLGNMKTLTHLDLSSLHTYEFPDWILHLPNLQYVNVAHGDNWRKGFVPRDLSRLTGLTYFNASGNGLSGYLPEVWSALKHLETLIIPHNNLRGPIPPGYSALSRLTRLDLRDNLLVESLPDVFTSGLKEIYLSDNRFSGSIPAFLGRLTGLTHLDLDGNTFTGGIPLSFTNLTGLMELNVANNSLTEGLDTVTRMTFLNEMRIGYNKFTGSVPDSLSSLSQLLVVSLSANRFTGTFPRVFSKMPQLVGIHIDQNEFWGQLPSYLETLPNLQSLVIGYNRLQGSLPANVYRLPKLQELSFPGNRIFGALPERLQASPDFSSLDVRGNGLSGQLPDFTQWNTTLRYLYLGRNNFSGSIPDSISTLTSLKTLILEHNHFGGNLPSSLVDLTNLENLLVNDNRFSGPLPQDIGRLSMLKRISLDNNKFIGKLPASFCALTNLGTIYMRNNLLYGPIPSCVFISFLCLNKLDISHNSFYGRISSNFQGMDPYNGALLNIAYNFFYGDPMLFADGCQFCPTNISGPNQISVLDLSGSSGGLCRKGRFNRYPIAIGYKNGRASLVNNCLTLNPEYRCTSNSSQRPAAACLAFCSVTDKGPCDGHGACVPPAAGSTANFTCECDGGYTNVTVAGGGSTCAIVKGKKAVLSTGAIVGISVGFFSGFAVLAATLAFLLMPRRQTRWSGLDVCQQFSLGDLTRATNNWSHKNLLGKGGFAEVFKGVAPDGTLWAVKRSMIMTNDFEEEVRAMSTLHHKHLVRLLGFCLDQNIQTGKQEQILVYEFVANQDLSYHIHNPKRPLTKRERLDIALGAAEGLKYLHSFETPIIHRDIKPENILVTKDMQAKVADFGLLKMLSEGDVNATRIAGTPGYVDPDYNRTRLVTTRSDVYSLGIVFLELLTGRSPRANDSQHIASWAIQRVAAYELENLTDPSLVAPEDFIVEFADLALDCIKLPGRRRPDMAEVAKRLKEMIVTHCAGEDGDTPSAPANATPAARTATQPATDIPDPSPLEASSSTTTAASNSSFQISPTSGFSGLSSLQGSHANSAISQSENWFKGDFGGAR